MTGQQPPVLACIVIQQAQRYRFMLCCLPTFTAFDTSKAHRRVLYAHGMTIVLIACSAPAKLCVSAAQKHSYKTLSPNMLSRKVIFPMWLCMGAMEREELSKAQMVSDSDWVGKSASVAHFICLSPTDSAFAPLRCDI
jgi:hypothetical protein